MDARAHFAELISLPEEEIPLAEAALWIAAETRPHVDVARCLAEFEALASRAQPEIDAADSEAERVVRLNHALFVSEGFRGNHADYADPQNSFLDAVLDRRMGIPITLSLVYVEVARRVGLEASGIGFPGHFLAKVQTASEEIIVDAFNGCTLTLEGCAERLAQVAGEGARLDPSMLTGARNRDVLRRILTNLKLLHVAEQDFESALGCSERILMLAPDDPLELRDRGLVYRELECFGAALDDLQAFLERVPHHESAEAIRPLVTDLLTRRRQIH
jgi:regulator of sirC expression with transglutaminase-like and TPR domain